MPIIKSAKKRVKVARTAAARNAKTRRGLRDALKAYERAVASGKSTEVAKLQPAAFSALDLAVKRAIIHKNRASRYKSRLAKQAKDVGVRLTAKPKKVTKLEKPASKQQTRK